MEIKIKKNHIRIVSSFLVGFIFACFGVFFFSDFQYRGLSLGYIESSFLSGGTFTEFMAGISTLLSSGLLADWFSEFSSVNIANSSINAIFFGETIWPALVTWFMAGFSIGVIVKGFKRGLILSLIIFLAVFFLYIITGIFAGTDITAIFITNITNTLGQLFTALLALIPGGIIGGLISGPYQPE